MQLIPDIYQLGGSLNGLSWTGDYKSYSDANTYLVKTQQGPVLFDCGNGETWAQLEAVMQSWGLDPADIRACFLTHAHCDHAGAAQLLAQRGIPLYAHEKTAQAIAAGDERCAGYLYHKTVTPCAQVQPLQDGACVTVGGLAVALLHFPGHTMGCAAYQFNHAGKRVLVSGDILGTLLDGDFGWDGSIDFDKAVYLQSLQKFAKTDCDLMLPGHGMVYFSHPRHRAEQALCAALSEWR